MYLVTINDSQPYNELKFKVPVDFSQNILQNINMNICKLVTLWNYDAIISQFSIYFEQKFTQIPLFALRM